MRTKSVAAHRPQCPCPKGQKHPMWTDFVRKPYADAAAEYWENSRYSVTKRVKTIRVRGEDVKVTALGIANYDQSARHDWREFQRIKNELIGPQSLAVEVYPEESKLHDPSNFFLLWVLPSGAIDCLLGERFVLDSEIGQFGPQRDREPSHDVGAAERR